MRGRKLVVLLGPNPDPLAESPRRLLSIQRKESSDSSVDLGDDANYDASVDKAALSDSRPGLIHFTRNQL